MKSVKSYAAEKRAFDFYYPRRAIEEMIVRAGHFLLAKWHVERKISPT